MIYEHNTDQRLLKEPKMGWDVIKCKPYAQVNLTLLILGAHTTNTFRTAHSIVLDV